MADAASRLQATEPDLPAGSARPGARRVLEAALGLFARHGFSGTSIRDIAAEAGLASAALYAHFESKDHVLAELVRIGHEEHHGRLRRAALGTAGDPEQQLRGVVGAHARFHAEYPVLATVCNNELHALPPALAAPALALRAQSEQLLQEIVELGIERGVFDPPHTWMTVAAIGGMGIRVAAWFAADLEIGIDEVADTYGELAVRMARADNTARADSTARAATGASEGAPT
ncbi:MAG TPA: TetR/AcrR family transcriptional regulator [Acidimicrobiales bacterium]|nr:TetR/AcrR family transcriptional regulator [Acidimicrobiales bacterium]